jgi:HEAT repeat protein
MKRLKTSIILIAAVAMLMTTVAAQTVPAADSEGKLLAVVKSDAPFKAKVDALRQLALVATKESVPVLAGLLGDEKLSHMARYAMETIDDPSVDAALCDALDNLKGKQLVGVIGSVGVRGKQQNVYPKLIKLLVDSDPLVAQAAARAMGSISRSGNPAIGNALLEALKDAPSANKLYIYEGLFRCAESLAKSDKEVAAFGIYEAIIKTDRTPHQVRGGAMRGAILTGGPKGAELLKKYLKSDDYIMFSAAVQATNEMADKEVTKILVDSLDGLSADNQVVIIETVATRGDSSVAGALYKLAHDARKPVRLAAIQAIPVLPTCGVGMVDLLADSDKEIAKAVFESIATTACPYADGLVVKLFEESSQPSKRLIAIDLMARRKVANLTPTLLAAVKDADESVRCAAIDLLGDGADKEQFGVLLDILLKASGTKEIRSAERAVSSVCARESRMTAGRVAIVKAEYGALSQGKSADVTAKVSDLVKAGAASIEASNANFGDPASGTVKQMRIEYTVDGVAQTVTVAEGQSANLAVSVVPDELIEQICKAVSNAAAPNRLALLRVLKATNGAKALDAIRTATGDSDTQVADEAVSLLCGWATPDALGDVMKIAAKSSSQRHRILAIRGALRLIPMQNASVGQKLGQIGAIVPRITRNEEKKLLLGALGAIESAEALGIVEPYLDDAATKDEAALAAVSIGEKVVARNPKEVQQVMNTVIKATTNEEVLKRARQLLKQSKN